MFLAVVVRRENGCELLEGLHLIDFRIHWKVCDLFERYCEQSGPMFRTGERQVARGEFESIGNTGGPERIEHTSARVENGPELFEGLLLVDFHPHGVLAGRASSNTTDS